MAGAKKSYVRREEATSVVVPQPVDMNPGIPDRVSLREWINGSGHHGDWQAPGGKCQNWKFDCDNTVGNNGAFASHVWESHASGWVCHSCREDLQQEADESAEMFLVPVKTVPTFHMEHLAMQWNACTRRWEPANHHDTMAVLYHAQQSSSPK